MPPPGLLPVEASIGAFRDDKKIMMLIAFENKVRCHKSVLWKTPWVFGTRGRNCPAQANSGLKARPAA